jgi:hypothetical protein
MSITNKCTTKREKKVIYFNCKGYSPPVFPNRSATIAPLKEKRKIIHFELKGCSPPVFPCQSPTILLLKEKTK